ncbi:hypothetical protein C0J52_08541 [Blattella germanica]|nr:hypothetical protein C0J52_08541 [Blattella germanica]PSN52308.1 hypothetical protein C0J52_08541 [Blattella germanica]
MNSKKNRKSPKRLSEIVLDQMKKRMEQRFENWFQNLTLWEELNRMKWFQVVYFVIEDSERFHQELCSISPCITAQIIPQLLEWFCMLAKVYSEKEGRSGTMAQRHKPVFDHIFEATLQSLLVPALREYDIKAMKTPFGRTLMLQAVGSSVNLTTLVLPGKPELADPEEIADKVQFLPMLTRFEYQHACTTQVLVSVGNTCDRLEELNVRYSRRTTDLCVESLLKLRNLQTVDVQFTGVSARGYSKLLQGLKLTSIVWPYRLDKLLRGVALAQLEDVTSVAGTFRSINTLFDKCPRVATLTLHSMRKDISALGHCTNITAFNLQNCNYNQVGAGCYLQGMGEFLVELRLFKVTDVHMIDIMTQSGSLKVLELHSCQFIDSTHDLDNEQQLKHFNSLEYLKITDCEGTGPFFYHVSNYTSLKFFYVRNEPALTGVSLFTMIVKGALANLEEFVAEDCGLRSIDFFIMLTDYCPKIGVIGNLKKTQQITKEDVQRFKDFVKSENLDIRVVAQVKHCVRPKMLVYRNHRKPKSRRQRLLLQTAKSSVTAT